MEQNEKTPQVRFKGYNDVWEQRKLGDMGTTFTGLSGKTKEDFGHGDAKFITYMNVFSNPIVDLQMTESIEIDDRQNSVKKGDVFFTTSSETPQEVGMTCVMPANADNIYLNSFCFGYRPTVKFNNNYLAYMLRSDPVRDKMTFLAQGISRYNISKNKVMEIDVPVPTLEEQAKIGQYFSNLDRLITLHQRKSDKLINVKKAMLEKLFPKNGSLYPEIRFEGFTDAWEQRKLGDVIEKLTGGVSIAPDDYTEDGYRTIPKGAVNSTGVADMSGCKYVSEDFFKKNLSSKTSSGEIVTSLRDLVPTAPNMGRIVRICGDSEDFLMPQGVYSIVTKDKISENFLIAYSNSPEYRRIIMAEKNGSTQVHIRNGEFLDIDIPLPSYGEQNKIGNFFHALDRLITLHQCKLEKLKKMKRSCLEKMFV